MFQTRAPPDTWCCGIWAAIYIDSGEEATARDMRGVRSVTDGGDDERGKRVLGLGGLWPRALPPFISAR